MRKTVIAAVVASLAATFAAAPASAQEGDLEEFCSTNVALDKADAAPTPKLLEKLRTTAPPEIAATVDSAVTTFEEQGDDAFGDPAFAAQIAEIDAFVVANCGFESFDVEMADYSFDGMPAEVAKGVVAFNLTNTGAELHEFVISRLKGDATLDDVLDLPDDAKEKAYKKFLKQQPGGGFAFPESGDVALVEFKKPGRYVALCFVPVGSTPDSGDEGGDGPPHLHVGMATEFEVTG
jgi:hypothetical protein